MRPQLVGFWRLLEVGGPQTPAQSLVDNACSEYIEHHTLIILHTDFSRVLTDVEALESASCGPAKTLSSTPEQEQTVTISNAPPSTAQMVPPDNTSPGPDENINQTER